MRLAALLFVCLLTASAVGQDDTTPLPEAETRDRDHVGELLQQKLDELKALRAQIELLRVSADLGPQQVLIKVRFFEASRTKIKHAGISLSDGGVAGLLAKTSTTKPVASKNSDPSSKATAIQVRPKDVSVVSNIEIKILDTDANHDAILDGWQKQGLVKLVCEWEIETYSGKPISLRDGGEFPIQVLDGNGNTKIEYRRFGAQIDAWPLLLDDGHIRLSFRPRLSSIDENRRVTIRGTEVPNLQVREVDTEQDLEPGQTLLVGGLTQFRQTVSRREKLMGVKGTDAIETLFLATVSLPDIHQGTFQGNERDASPDVTPR